MLPILIAVAAIAAVAIAIPAASSDGKSADATRWLPWGLLVMGLVGLGTGILQRDHKIDPKQGVRANAFVVFFGPVGARVAWTLVGGAFIGGAIGCFVAASRFHG